MARPLLVCLALALIAAGPLSGTTPWAMPADPAREMVEGLHTFLDRMTAASVATRAERWRYDLSSRAAFDRSVEPNRRRLEVILGATGARTRPVALRHDAGPETPVPLAANASIKITAARWSVYPGFEAEGLLVEPMGEGKVKAVVVAIPDAGTTPEQLAGLAPGLPDSNQVAARLAEAGCRVLVPTLIDRRSEFSGSPLARSTNLPGREWIYRMAFEAGRHLIGYEVDEVRAGIDWLTSQGGPRQPVAVVGHGEGGLIALFAAALDTRVDTAWVAGSFGPRERVWAEPIDRNVWGLLNEFGDAELAGLLTFRNLIVDASAGPRVSESPPKDGRSEAAPGTLGETSLASIEREWARLLDRLPKVPTTRRELVKVGVPSPKAVFNDGAQAMFLDWLGLDRGVKPSLPVPGDPRPGDPSRSRMARLVGGMQEYTQGVLRASELRRDAYWSRADRSTVAAWEKSTEPYRDDFWVGLIGKLPPASVPLDARSRLILDEPRWTGYAIQIPLWPDVFASGVLLVPNDLKPGERRPVVVCQHGLEGTPEPVVNPRAKSVYRSFGAQLADRGYIVYAPQNPYIGHDRFRQLQRKANPLGQSLFAIIARQHERTLEWLATRPEVDPARIAFYGLSYGGKTAMRVPAILKGYCLSICSGDFNEWVVKCTNPDRKYSYLYTLEYDMYEFGLAERFNYAEMAALIAPRPFMVERGHDDGVAIDEWVGYEFAKVKRLYDRLGIGDRAGLAVFNGGHQIDGAATFAFLATHLRWPRGLTVP